MFKRLSKVAVIALVAFNLAGCGHHQEVKLSDADLDKLCPDIEKVKDPDIRQHLAEKCPLRGSFHKSALKEW